MVSHHGDCYGEVVNLAARLVKAADPGTVLVSEPLGSLSRGKRVELAAPKGYDEPIGAWRLVLR